MSLMKTLAKVAIGVAVAKGAKSMMGGGRSGSGGGLLGGLLGGGGQQGQQTDTRSASSSGPGGLLGSLLGGGSGASGGLGGMLEQLSARSNPSGGGGNSLSTDETAPLRNQLPSDLQSRLDSRGQSEGSFGEVLNSHFSDGPTKEPSAEQEAIAALMIRAMAQAAKSDGQLDAGEREKLTKQLEDADASERQFVQDELNKPVDVDGLVRDVPRGLEPQVYTMSLLGIDLDTNTEAQYLHQLAEGLNLSRSQVNDIHDQMGVQKLYS